MKYVQEVRIWAIPASFGYFQSFQTNNMYNCNNKLMQISAEIQTHNLSNMSLLIP